jgi:HD-GYP domain-containing protein (c-di-GMP phosphodiesterase class II)
MSARIIGLADVFEALTASDRPYKPGKPLSEALEILGKMVRDRHIDPDLFDIFVRDGVWLDYARRYLQPEQIDAVDLDRIPGYTP